jgi:hypothetical protein
MSDNTDEDEGPYAFSDYVPAQLFPTDSHPNPHEDTGQPHIEVRLPSLSLQLLNCLIGVQLISNSPFIYSCFTNLFCGASPFSLPQFSRSTL